MGSAAANFNIAKFYAISENLAPDLANVNNNALGDFV